jgi:hypothetical protein
MTRRVALLSSILLVSVALSPLAHADSQRMVDPIKAATVLGRDSWRATKSALKNLAANKPLRAKIGATGQVMVLGERSGSLVRPTLAYAKSLHLGMSAFEGYMGVKINWKEQLVLGSNGLAIQRLHSVSKPSEASVRSFQADLEGQFAKKPSSIKMPSVELTYEPFTPYKVVKTEKARVGWLGLGSTRLKPETWGHVTSEQIQAALQNLEHPAAQR